MSESLKRVAKEFISLRDCVEKAETNAALKGCKHQFDIAASYIRNLPERVQITIFSEVSPKTIAKLRMISDEFNDIYRKILGGSSVARKMPIECTALQKAGASILPKGDMPFKLGKQVGKGGYGLVYEGVHADHKEDVAIKEIKIGQRSSLKILMNEISIIRELAKTGCNDYIVQTHEIYVNSKCDNLYILMEYMPRGDLKDVLKKLSVQEGVKLLKDGYHHLMKGLECLHINQLYHRDIKPQNILVTSDGVLKYADFGLMCIKECSTRMVGTPNYVDPYYYHKKRPHLKEADNWSLAMTLLNMLLYLSVDKKAWVTYWDVVNAAHHRRRMDITNLKLMMSKYSKDQMIEDVKTTIHRILYQAYTIRWDQFVDKYDLNEILSDIVFLATGERVTFSKYESPEKSDLE